MKAAICARVSTGHQDPGNQAIKLRQFAAEHGFEIAREYMDQESGRSSSRAAFRQMMHDARRRRFDTLLFFSFSRLSREGLQRTAWYLHEPDQAGVSYISVSERDWLDFTGRWAFVITMMMATIAQMEVEPAPASNGRDSKESRSAARGGSWTKLPRPQFRAEGLSLSEIAKRSGVSVRTLKRRIP